MKILKDVDGMKDNFILSLKMKDNFILRLKILDWKLKFGVNLRFLKIKLICNEVANIICFFNHLSN